MACAFLCRGTSARSRDSAGSRPRWLLTIDNARINPETHERWYLRVCTRLLFSKPAGFVSSQNCNIQFLSAQRSALLHFQAPVALRKVRAVTSKRAQVKNPRAIVHRRRRRRACGRGAAPTPRSKCPLRCPSARNARRRLARLHRAPPPNRGRPIRRSCPSSSPDHRCRRGGILSPLVNAPDVREISPFVLET